MKRYALLAIFTLLISIQSATQIATATITKETKSNTVNIQTNDKALLRHIAQTKKQQEEEKRLTDNYKKIKEQIKDLKKYVGKTYYVFSGSSPRGWDCSGLTRWFYEGLGVEIPHSAHQQLFVGQQVTVPQIGDIVLMDYWKNGKIDHAAIYIGDGDMIHAGFEKGDRTEMIEDFASIKEAKITYVRLFEIKE